MGPLRPSNRQTFGSRALTFYANLAPPPMPRGIVVMNPYATAEALGYSAAFFSKFFDDNKPRVMSFGINAGRFGAGVTGVTFTDPVALSDFCGIPNSLPRKRELSSVFIYDFITAMGGPARFYSRFFLSAVCPLGFTRDGVNLNYYDVPLLQKRVTPFIIDSIRRHIEFGGRTDVVIILGRGKNLRFFERLNSGHGFFDRILSLDHPRFIMQYRRKRAGEYIDRYRDAFTQL
jgi:hypothetical protein